MSEPWISEPIPVPYRIDVCHIKDIYTIVEIDNNKEIAKFKSLKEAETFMWNNLVN